MILHFSHIGLTDGRTFMFPFGLIRCDCGDGALMTACSRREKDWSPRRARGSEIAPERDGAE